MMVDTVSETTPDPEDAAEEEGGSGMPMTASEIVAEDENDTDDSDDSDDDDGEESEAGDDTDDDDADEDEEEGEEAAA